ncbi:MAG: electron transporter [Cyanobacteria bacterium P01_F01_bin.150]
MFAPIVVALRNSLGKRKFNRLRGKVIKLHSQVITNFCNQFSINRTTRQNLIRQAKHNGEVLGFLA